MLQSTIIIFQTTIIYLNINVPFNITSNDIFYVRHKSLSAQMIDLVNNTHKENLVFHIISVQPGLGVDIFMSN